MNTTTDNTFKDIHVVDESETHCKIRQISETGEARDSWIRREELVMSLPEAAPPGHLAAEMDYFLSRIALEVKKCLHPTLGINSYICIRIDTFTEVYDRCFRNAGLRVAGDGCWHKLFTDHAQLEGLLGKNWSVRLLNRSGVFCYVIPGTFRLSLRCHPPVKEYVWCDVGFVTKWSWKGVYCQVEFEREFGVGRDYFDLKWKDPGY